MLYNYLKTAVRNLLRHRFFSAINIFGLAVAMSICMALIMLVADQLSYDRHNGNADRIYRVTTIDVYEGKVMIDNQVSAASCMPVGPELVENYTGIEEAVRLRRGFGNGWLEFEKQNVTIPLAGYFADPNVLEFFQYDLQYGDAATALLEPYTVVLTRSAANKLFKEENPLGQTIKVGELGTYTVTGVLKNPVAKSHIVFEGLASMASVKSMEAAGKMRRISDNWHSYWEGWTYIRTAKDKSPEEIQSQLDNVYAKHIDSNPNPTAYKMVFRLQPLLDITPGNMMRNSIGPELPWELVYFLAGLALIILLTSCFNFTNLSIARSLTRAREIGVRKVTGAMRWQIFSQFISESVVVALAALATAVVLLFALKPMVLNLTFAQFFRWDMNESMTVYALFIVFAIVVGLLAGFFPAVILSGLQPVSVLKNLSNVKLLSCMGMRKALLVSQFTISLLFILSVIVLYNQLNLFTHQDHGFNVKSNILVNLNSTSYQNLKTELQKYNNITSISGASHVPAAGESYGTGIKRKAEDIEPIDAGYYLVDADYAKNMNLKLLAGNFFNSELGESNAQFAIVNEAATKKMNFGTPLEAIGETVIDGNDSTTRTIVGVVANYNHKDLTRKIGPVLLMYRPSSFKVLQVAYNGPYEDAGKSIEKAWSTVNPGLKVDYVAVESEINKYYDIVFGDLVKVLGAISFLAIFISCLGLLGMATYATETRIKEIAIRKVLGSTGAALVLLLSRGFVGIIGLSIAIGLPLAWFVNNLWLEQIAYHTTVGIGVMMISVLVLVVLGILTIGSQTLRATLVNPVDNLKSE